MNKLVTILSFPNIHELAIVRGRLESEGIKCFVQDDNVIQANPFYSNAIGGVKLQVRESDVESAKEILKETGYLPDDPIDFPERSDTNEIRQKEFKTSRLKVFIVVGVIVAVLSGIGLVYFATLPTISDQLTRNTWCMDYVEYDNKVFKPKSYGIVMSRSETCDEIITFFSHGRVHLPGFESYGPSGTWYEENEKLIIAKADSFGYIYDGEYSVDIAEKQMLLKSKTTTIYCHSENIKFPF